MADELSIRPARTDEAEEISALALRSKSHWGYDEDFLAACRSSLTISAADCASGAVMVAERGGTLLGFYQLSGAPPHGELADLFVDLGTIGTGVGGSLLAHALARASAQGFTDLTLEADPGAESFYARHGAVRIGESASSAVPDRVLPRMRFDLAPRPNPAAVDVRACEEGDVARLTTAEPSGADIARRIFARQQAGESVLLVAWLAGDPVGTGELVLGKEPELRSLHVREGHRGRGIGSALVSEAESRAAASGSLSVGVGLDNEGARRLYERLGYRATGELTTTTYTYVDAAGPHEVTETDERLVRTFDGAANRS